MRNRGIGEGRTKRQTKGKRDGCSLAYPWPPVLGGAPVSPSAMARAVVLKVARRGSRAALLVRVVRSIVGSEGFSFFSTQLSWSVVDVGRCEESKQAGLRFGGVERLVSTL